MMRAYRPGLQMVLVAIAMGSSDRSYPYSLGVSYSFNVKDKENKKFYELKCGKRVSQKLEAIRQPEYTRRFGNGGRSGRVPYHIKRRG